MAVFRDETNDAVQCECGGESRSSNAVKINGIIQVFIDSRFVRNQVEANGEIFFELPTRAYLMKAPFSMTHEVEFNSPLNFPRASYDIDEHFSFPYSRLFEFPIGLKKLRHRIFDLESL